MKGQKMHLTTEGLENMKEIKKKMNRGEGKMNHILSDIPLQEKFNAWAVCDESRTYGS